MLFASDVSLVAVVAVTTFVSVMPAVPVHRVLTDTVCAVWGGTLPTSQLRREPL
jgi:hypothetical protein